MKKYLTATALLLVCVSASAADTREHDRELIRAHVDAIFNAYIHKDRETIRKTHSEDWRGFLTGSRTIIKGIDQYMAAADGSIRNADSGMTAYKMREFDIVFRGDIAIINYVADVDGHTGADKWQTILRVLDIYEKRSGEWIQIASNTCQHPDAIGEQMKAAAAKK